MNSEEPGRVSGPRETPKAAPGSDGQGVRLLSLVVEANRSSDGAAGSKRRFEMLKSHRQPPVAVDPP